MAAVVHLLNAYLPVTETFIWQYLRQAQDFPPQIVADRWENLESFPLPNGEASFLRLRPLRPLWKRVWAGLEGGYAQVDYEGWETLLRGRDIALAHAHQGFRAIVTQKLLQKSGLPFAASFYGSDVSRSDIVRRGRAGYREVFRRAGMLCAEGPALRKRLVDLGASEEKIKLVRIAIDLADYAYQERHWSGQEPLRLLFVGRLVEKKGLEFGLRALAGLAKKQGSPDFHLTVIGDGPLRVSLQALAQDLGLQPHIEWKGLLSLSVLRGILSQQHALLAPSCTATDGDSEGGAPTVILEAQATGMPIISTTHADIPFITVPGKSAYLAGERDVEGLTDALVRFAAHPDLWAEMGRAGRAHVAVHHDARQAIAILEGYYRSLLG
jgi:colanic acid/amylovoran biosynthesis glycosyltransferase